jgi:hypothetical protein
MAVGALLDQLSESSAEVMQAHWSDYADSALFSLWLGRRRALADDGPLRRNDPLIDAFPWLSDLPRIAAMVDLSPWREPLRDRERVEAFRRRIRRIVRLHRDGLGTVRALRGMTEAALPQIDPDARAGLRERNFTIDEFSGGQRSLQAVGQAGLPADMVGPLMRWSIDSGSLRPVSPMVVIQGVTPLAAEIDATSDPLIERFNPQTGTGVGILYQGELAPGEALALLPGYHSWLGHDTGVDRADTAPVALETVNPTAPGPWSVDGGGPTGAVVDLQQTEDHFLWAAVNAAEGSLWRRDDSGWTEILSGLPQIHCLLPRGGELLVGFASGLSRLAIQPAGPFELSPDPATLTDPAVRALATDSAGQVWAATGQGLAQLESGVLTYTPQALGGLPGNETALACLWLDDSGDIYCGGELGLFLYRVSQQRWYILQGEAGDEAVDDWLELDVLNDSLPDANDLFVPPVTAVVHAADTDIWLGTAQGIARYRARETRRTYTTLLEALPQLTEAPVSRIGIDARDRLWFATGQGLFLYDQLDWFQRQADSLVRLPRAVDDPLQTVFWRYQRSGASWQLMTAPGNGAFRNYSGAPLGASEPALHALAWTESAQARLGSFDGSVFTVDEAATPGPLSIRYKPEPTRIVDGGLTALPRLPGGTSNWRYLQREEPAPPTPNGFPAWTREGRLLPPPDSSEAPVEGRFLALDNDPESAVFAYCPAARVWFLWQPRAPLAVTVRLTRTAPQEQIDPQILDRVWNELQRVKPAAVVVYLAVDETIERGL